MSSIVYQKPFIKWAGGKTQIIDKIMNNFPKEINNYYEIFLGGGSVLLALLSEIENKRIKLNGKIYVYDINNILIDLYKNIKCKTKKLIKYINKYVKEYESCDGEIINRKPENVSEAKSSKESYYYWLRNKFNKIENSVKRSALFLVINKLCFRGLYREGPNGFNVPYGHYKKTPQFLKEPEEELLKIKKLIKNVNFECLDFSKSLEIVLNNYKSNDFVYLDPPYVPVDKKSFVSYNKNGFSEEMHLKLFNLLKKLTEKNIKFMMSNVKVKIILEKFKNYEIIDILCRRAINSKNPESTIYEVIVKNYNLLDIKTKKKLSKIKIKKEKVVL